MKTSFNIATRSTFLVTCFLVTIYSSSFGTDLCQRDLDSESSILSYNRSIYAVSGSYNSKMFGKCGIMTLAGYKSGSQSTTIDLRFSGLDHDKVYILQLKVYFYGIWPDESNIRINHKSSGRLAAVKYAHAVDEGDFVCDDHIISLKSVILRLELPLQKLIHVQVSTDLSSNSSSDRWFGIRDSVLTHPESTRCLNITECHSSCLRCTSAGNFECTLCSNDHFAQGQQCVKACEDGWYLDSKSSKCKGDTNY